MASNDDLLARGAQVIPGGVCSWGRKLPVSIIFTSASGSRLCDSNGKEYVDYHAAYGPILLGHCHPEVNRKVAETMNRLDLVGAGPTELEFRVAERIVTHVPSAEKVLFCSSGSEATYHAVRLARGVTGKRKLVKFQGCMHGWHDYLYMNIWSPPQYLGRLHPHSAGMLKEAVENTLVVRYNDLDEVEEVLARERGQVAALFVEPVAHNVGCILPKPGFLEGLRDLCTMYDVILIFDEVVTGFRHALGGYQSICGVVPDITVLAKAMSNGYPCAAICGRADLMDNFSSAGGPVTISGTFNANPVGLSAALATIEILEKNEVHHHIFKLGEMMRQGLADITHRLGIPAYVTGVGSTFVSYFLEGPVESFDDVLRHDADLFVAFTLKMIERGFFLLPMSPRRGYISASHTSEDIARTLEAANDSLKEVTGR